MKRIKCKRSANVKDRISDAFIALLKEKKFNEITIVEIINKAQVGRVSFYRNFQDKDDVLRYYVTSETDDWLSQTGENYITLTKDGIKPYIVFLLSHMYEHRAVVDIFLQNGKMHLLEEEFDRRFFSRLSDTASQWEIAYKVGGVYKLFCYWVRNGYQKTPQEIAEFIE